MSAPQTQFIPEFGYVRLPQIIGRAADTKHTPPRPAIPAIIPVSRSSWWAGVAAGKYPKPVKLGPRTTAWRVEDIRDLIAKTGAK